jgi:hypothetical protein
LLLLLLFIIKRAYLLNTYERETGVKQNARGEEE